MGLGRNGGKTGQRLTYVSALMCSLAACGSSDRPPPAGGPDMDFSPSVGEDAEVDAGAAADGGRDGGRDGAAAQGDADLPDLPDNPPPDDPDTERLVVTDATDAKLYVLDARDFSLVETFDAAAGSHVLATRGGRYALTYAADGDGVSVLDVGLGRESQSGGAPRPTVSAPTLLAGGVAGDSPRLVVADDDTYAVSFSGEARAVFFSSAELPASLGASSVDTGSAHDGVALSVGGIGLVSERPGASDDWTLRSVASMAGVNLPACTNPDLASVASAHAVVGCADGLAFLTASDVDTLNGTLYPYDDAAGAGARARAVAGRSDGTAFAALVGEAGVQLVTAEETLFRDLGEPVVALAFPAPGKLLWVLSAAGGLHALDVATLSAVGEPVDVGCATASGDAAPALRFGKRAAYLTCPSAGEVRVLALGTGEVSATHSVGSAPLDLAAFSF